VKSLVRPTAGFTAAMLAAIGAGLIIPAGILSSFEQRLSDAWFSIDSMAPSGRTVLVFVDKAAQLRGAGVRIARRDLAELLLKLDAGGAARVLIEIGLADQYGESEDELLAQTLARLGPKVAVSTSAILAGNGEQARWRRTASSQSASSSDQEMRCNSLIKVSPVAAALPQCR